MYKVKFNYGRAVDHYTFTNEIEAINFAMFWGNCHITVS